MSAAWILRGSGRQNHAAWTQLHQHTRGWTAAWADTSGFHLEPMPTTAPATTHLWAFTTHQWLRVRIDVPYWWAAALTLDTEFNLPWTRMPTSAPTVVRVRHWNSDDNRIKQYTGPAGVLGHHEHVQLLPHLPLCAPFLGHQDSLPPEYRKDIDVSPLPDDADEDKPVAPAG
ncbi:hypothetical protein ACWGPQ_07115 [Saccharomonospora azurea]